MEHFNDNSALAFVKQFLKDHNIQHGDVIVGAITPINIAGHHIVVLPGFNFIQNSYGLNINRPSIINVAYDLLTFKRVQRFVGNSFAREMVVQRALRIEMEGRTYSWGAYNCEDFSCEVQTGIPKSKQVQNATAIAVTAGLALTTFGIAKKNEVVALGGLAILLVTAFSNGQRSSYQNNL